jgi:predicted permease
VPGLCYFGGMDELRLAIRRLAKRPAATTASILTLACAIGAAAATWSLLSAVLLRPLPVRDPDRLVLVGEWRTSDQRPQARTRRLIYPFYPLIKDSGIFHNVAATWGRPIPLLVRTAEIPASSPVAFVTHEFFDLLGIRLTTGRGITEDEDRVGAPLVAVLSHAYWQRAFDGDRAAIGRSITIAGHPATIVGVAARGFRGLDLSVSPDVYVPFHSIEAIAPSNFNYFSEPGRTPSANIAIIGRMREGLSDREAMDRLSGLVLPGERRERRFALTRVNTAAISAGATAGLAQFTSLLTTTVGLLVLIGCSTVGMLLLVRTEARRDEFAMCLALGASRARLARGIVLEGALLAVAGAVLSLPLAWWMLAGVRSFQLPGSIAIDRLELGIDLPAVLAAAGGAVSATLIIALVAGAFGFRADIADALRARSGATPRIQRRKTRGALVAGQVAVALVLLAGAGLFARSLREALRLNPEIETDRILTSTVSLRPHGYGMIQAAQAFDHLCARLAANPGIAAVSISGPPDGFGGGPLTIDGVPRHVAWFDTIAIRPNYFDTLGLPIAAGRAFGPTDTRGAPLVGVVSESFGRFLAEGGDPIGRRITLPYSLPSAPPPVVEIVGVVPDFITDVKALEPWVLYVPLAQDIFPASRTIVLRATASLDTVRRELLTAVRELDRNVTPGPALTLDERLTRQMRPQQFGISVLGALGAIAALLTLIGTYVLSESMAVMRMREMGIRAALGASRTQLAAIVLKESVQLVGLGLTAGLGLAWLGASTIRALLFRVEPLDPLTLGAVSTVLLVLALTVSLRPALRAARVDLASVLRQE